MIALLLLACSEYGVREPDPTPPADPPGLDPDADFGQPPDWQDCYAGYYGQYYNLPADHPDVEPEADALAPADPEAVDWWDPSRVSFRQYDGSLDLGSNWWPVDDGLEADPLYFSVRWTAWMRAWSGTQVTVQLAVEGDAWVLADKQVVVAQPASIDATARTFQFALAGGQYPFDVRFAQRAGDASTFRFRVIGGDVSVCYPDFSGE